jgi:hypothetical protein
MRETVKLDPPEDYQPQRDEWKRQRAAVEEQLMMLRQRQQAVREQREMVSWQSYISTTFG